MRHKHQLCSSAVSLVMNHSFLQFFRFRWLIVYIIISRGKLFQTQRFMALIQLVAAVGVSFALSYLVQRAKQCLDFACTVHFFHLICTTVYNRALPTQLTWWILQVLSTTVCTVLGEYLCMRIESQEIKLEGGPSRYDL
ncbi:unnamed protein product [Caenorhabditis brenneri]